MIIAEIGQNFLGLMDLATDLIRLAKDNGADLAKFQLYDHKKLYGDKDIPNVELSFEQAKGLFEYGKQVGIEVFFSVFDVERVKWCEEIGVKRYKIASLLDDDTVINAVKATGRDIIESTASGRRFPYPHKALYCPSGYPQTNIDLRNLRWADGFSDHTLNLTASKVAISRGAQIIEKHFAIDHETGIDAKWSMTPDELRELKRWADVCKQVL